MGKFFLTAVSVLFVTISFSQNNNSRKVISLEDNWQFINEDVEGAENPELNATNWETVSVPDDWAIKGPFDKEIDAQKVRVFYFDITDHLKEGEENLLAVRLENLSPHRAGTLVPGFIERFN